MVGSAAEVGTVSRVWGEFEASGELGSSRGYGVRGSSYLQRVATLRADFSDEARSTKRGGASR